jgi:peptidoglycan/xylan/chitin deacetylase (PgdA/CDA1 family)
MFTALFGLLLLTPRQKCVALTYHDITPRKAVWFDCTPAEFRSQIGAMKRAGVHFVSLSQVESYLHGGTLPSRPVALTFADNYHGFLDHAYPILKSLRIPVAMFVHTGFVGSKVGRPKMSWPEIERLDREGLVTFASQTVTHRDLPTLSDDEIGRELRDSKTALERHLRHPIRYLAYPDGAVDARVEQAVATSGLYTLAFGEIQAPMDQSLFRVNRYVHTKWRRALRDAGITPK